MRPDRPILVLEKSRTEVLMDIFSLIMLITCWAMVIFNYKSLPQIIPIHYDLNGNIDNYGSKATIWILPVLATLIIAGMRFINKFPHHFNYLVKITHDNAEVQYHAATKMLRYFQCMVSLIFAFIMYDLIQSARTGSSIIGIWFLPVLLVIFLGPLIISLFRSKSK